ncbi:MAG: hypothetical protein WAZ98_07995 [Cyclobacteriaceae bacterium]
MENKEIFSKYNLLASLVDFPGVGFVETVRECQLYLDGKYPDLSEVMEPFTDFVSEVSLDELQELHTRTFDVQAITTLDLGYLLFGDDYKRAELLVNLNREHTEACNSCGHELADHLPNVIRLVSKMPSEELRNELVIKLICPGLTKMISEFEPFNLEKKNEVYKRHHKTLIEMPASYGTLYQRPLSVLLEIFRMDFELPVQPTENTADFMEAISTEMKLEE